jgi:tRNA threonylcarbamoyladenosine biosynthesis protein TsaB
VDLDAISISKGPGSYTGLRIGVSTAKGLSYSLNRPLISVSTLRSMAFYMSQKQSNYDLYCPMIDARRMEVFSSFYDKDNNQLRAVMADIIDENSYNKELKNKVLFFGDGSNKCKDVLTSGNAYFTDNFSPSATYMGILSLEKYNNKDFEDVAYFEPFYLKDFVIGKKN